MVIPGYEGYGRPALVSVWDGRCPNLPHEPRGWTDAPADQYFRQGLNRTFGAMPVTSGNADVTSLDDRRPLEPRVDIAHNVMSNVAPGRVTAGEAAAWQ